MTACVCWETRISYTRHGLGYIAPVTYRCAEHRAARRVEDNGKASAVAQFFAAARRLQRALPAPPLLLAYYPVEV